MFSWVVGIFAFIGLCWVLRGICIFAVRAFPMIHWGQVSGLFIVFIFYVIWVLGLWKAYDIARWLYELCCL